MTSIQEIVAELQKCNGVRGVVVMTLDGIAVTSVLDDSLPPDLVTGLTSFLTSTIQRILSEGGMGSFTNFTMHSTHGKVFIVDLGECCLIVLTSQFGKLEANMPEIQETAYQLKRLSRISS